jgi:hypothetical protein
MPRATSTPDGCVVSASRFSASRASSVSPTRAADSHGDPAAWSPVAADATVPGPAQADSPTWAGTTPSAWAPRLLRNSRTRTARPSGRMNHTELPSDSALPGLFWRLELELLARCSARSGRQAPTAPAPRFRQAARFLLGWPRSTSAVRGSAPPAKSLPGTIGPDSPGSTGIASAPPAKSEPTGGASCRIGLIVCVGVGMQ